MVVGEYNEFKGLIIVIDFCKVESYLSSCKDDFGCLCVGVVVGIGVEILSCVEVLVEVGVDVIVVDMVYGYFVGVIECVCWVKVNYL